MSVPRLALVVALTFAVGVPVAVNQLNVTHPAFDHAPGHQAHLAEPLRRPFVGPVQLDGRLGLPGKVEHFWGGRLHPKGQLERFDAGFERPTDDELTVVRRFLLDMTDVIMRHSRSEPPPS